MTDLYADPATINPFCDESESFALREFLMGLSTVGCGLVTVYGEMAYSYLRHACLAAATTVMGDADLTSAKAMAFELAKHEGDVFGLDGFQLQAEQMPGAANVALVLSGVTNDPDIAVLEVSAFHEYALKGDYLSATQLLDTLSLRFADERGGPGPRGAWFSLLSMIVCDLAIVRMAGVIPRTIFASCKFLLPGVTVDELSEEGDDDE